MGWRLWSPLAPRHHFQKQWLGAKWVCLFVGHLHWGRLGYFWNCVCCAQPRQGLNWLSLPRTPFRSWWQILPQLLSGHIHEQGWADQANYFHHEAKKGFIQVGQECSRNAYDQQRELVMRPESWGGGWSVIEGEGQDSRSRRIGSLSHLLMNLT